MIDSICNRLSEIHPYPEHLSQLLERNVDFTSFDCY